MTWTSGHEKSEGSASIVPPLVGAQRKRAAHPAPVEGRTSADARRILIVSNRGPVSFTVDPRTGKFESQHGAGGVVSGLLSATQGRPVTWIALAMSAADRAIARAHEGGAPLKVRDLPTVSLRLVDTPEATYRRYYDGVSNRALWFIQHYLLRPTSRLFSSQMMKDWEEGYCVVNEAVAQAVIDELETSGEQTPVLFQDYHLYLAPAIVRERLPWARLTHFVHIPWPEARYWELAPEAMTVSIFAGLVANDIIGFQTEHDARNFLDGAQRFLPDATVEEAVAGEIGALLIDGRRVSARVYPIAVTPTDVFAQAKADTSDDTRALLARARPTPAHKVIVRVDRVEPTKNIVAGFRAYERMLQHHKAMRGRVTFVALLVPSREGLAEYRKVMRDIERTIERINKRYGTETWQPILAVFGNDRARAIACMREFDALLVNPLLDGMNLVVKEGALINNRAGVVVLSRTAGAFEQLGQYALGVPPTDIDAMSDALYQALTMPMAERRARATGLLNILLRESATTWLEAQLRDLTRQTGRPQVVYRTEKSARPTSVRHAADLMDHDTLVTSRGALTPRADEDALTSVRLR